jgi:DnaJ-class molecular chaperone
MNNHDYPVGSDNSDAPWNKEDGPMKECTECDGIGRFECEECSATGSDYNGDDCPYCNGIKTLPCSTCNGSGLIEMSDEEIEDAHEAYFEEDRDDWN